MRLPARIACTIVREGQATYVTAERRTPRAAGWTPWKTEAPRARGRPRHSVNPAEWRGRARPQRTRMRPPRSADRLRARVRRGNGHRRHGLSGRFRRQRKRQGAPPTDPSAEKSLPPRGGGKPTARRPPFEAVRHDNPLPKPDGVAREDLPNAHHPLAPRSPAGLPLKGDGPIEVARSWRRPWEFLRLVSQKYSVIRYNGVTDIATRKVSSWIANRGPLLSWA